MCVVAVQCERMHNACIQSLHMNSAEGFVVLFIFGLECIINGGKALLKMASFNGMLCRLN